MKQKFQIKNNLIMHPKYKRISVRSSQSQANYVIQEILGSANREISTKNIVKCFPTEMAKQIVLAQSQSIQQIRANSPSQPYWIHEEIKPNKGFIDTIRPYSARIQRTKKTNTFNSRQQTISRPMSSLRASSITRTLHSFKSIKSINPKLNKKQEYSQMKQYKSKLIPLPCNIEQNEQYDKIIEQLRKKKQKAEQYEKAKQVFLNSINKQNQEYGKRQAKFASTMCRKDYTYTYTGQIIEVFNKKGVMKKRSNPNKNKITSVLEKQDEHVEQSKQIAVQYTKREPLIQIKEYIFGEGGQQAKPNIYYPNNTGSTKFTLLVQDC